MQELYEHRQARWLLERLLVMGNFGKRNMTQNDVKECINITIDALIHFDKTKIGDNCYVDGFER